MTASGVYTKGKKNQGAAEKSSIAANVQEEEKRLEEILSKIEGAGSVSVMITYYSGTEKSIAYETKQNTSSSDGRSDTSEDKKAVMTDGEPMVVKEVYPKVKGVIVVAQGAESVSVKQAISHAVEAACDVPAHRICIYKKEE